MTDKASLFRQHKSFVEQIFAEPQSAQASAEQLAFDIADLIRQRLNLAERASVAFSGGSTPALMLRALARQALDWHRVDVTLVDERCVDETSARSNARLLKESCLNHLPVSPAFYPLYIGSESHSERGQRLEAIKQPFDLVHLGMGNDAHTASFFPDAENIAEMLDHSTVSNMMQTQSAASQEPRLTWSLKTLLDARQIVLQIKGSEKQQAIESVISNYLSAENDDERAAVRQRLPIAAVLECSRMSRLPSRHVESTEQLTPFSIYFAADATE